MITVNEIRKKAERIYPEVLRNYLLGEDTFPKIIRSDKSLSKDFVIMGQEIAQIMATSKDRIGFGYTVKSEPVKTKLHGIQNIPNTIVFETLTDFLKFLGKKNEYDKFVEQIQLILSLYPQLKTCLIKKPELVIDNFGKWDDLLKVGDWFLKSFEADKYYIRELPISVHSKFIEENKATLRIILDELISDKVNSESTDFEKRFRLKYAEPTIRFRFLESMHQKNFYYSDISVPITQFTDVPLSCSRVFIIENLMNFLTFPQVTDSIAVWGKGFAIDCLKQVNWLNDKEIFYWSDLDVQGFQMLSQLRSYFQQTYSFLMDMETLKSYQDFWVKGTPSSINGLNYLNIDEHQTYNFLRENNIRLEQERILHFKVIESLFFDNPKPPIQKL
jgi:hypothetical protein